MFKRTDNNLLYKVPVLTALLLAFCFAFTSCSGAIKPRARIKSDIDYSKPDMWIYAGGSEAEADCFYICPTVYYAIGNNMNMPVTNPLVKPSFISAVNSQKGVYSDSCSMYAPLYRQVAMEVYGMDSKKAEQYFDTAYADVENAFLFYLQNCNNGRPLVLAGFSQGADMCIRLLKDHGNDPRIRKVLVACYAIGWRLTDEEVSKNPHLKTAEKEDDTGVIICYDCEAEDVTKSLVVPEGTKTRSINPLNWKTDSTAADKTLNKGSILNDGSQAANLIGCYIDPVRGTLKVPDVVKGDYPPGPSCFAEGEYHIYNVNFFYQNLRENVAVRLKAFKAA